MFTRTALPLFACMMIVGCAAEPYDGPATRSEVVQPTVAVVAPIPPVAPAPALQLRSAGSVVGLPVVDQAGQSIGIVQAVAAEREAATSAISSSPVRVSAWDIISPCRRRMRKPPETASSWTRRR